MSRTPIFYIDVDDTLVRHIGPKIIPIPKSIKHIKLLKEEGATLYCWSSAGAAEAERICTMLGIEKLFEAFLPKPNVLIDDCKVDSWPSFEQVHPNAVSSDGVDFYRKRLKW